MNKGKILKITENTVYIGYEDGSLKEIPIESCEFEPRMGDYVEVYDDIAIKVEGSKESTPVKKSEAKKISLVSKINLISFVVLAMIILSAAFYVGESMLKATAILFFVVSVLMIVLNLIFIIISSIKKSEVNKESSIKYFIVGILTVILSIAFAQYVNNTPSNSKKTISQSTSKPSTSSSQESSSSSTKSSISGNIPKNLLTIDYEERTDKQKYSSSFDYDKWIHDEFPHYLKLHVRGEVVQILKDPDDKGVLIQIVLNEIGRPGLGKPVSVFIPNDYLLDIIVEGDKLDLYGKTYGVKQYSSGDSVVISPFMIAYFYERDK
ncbi:hypothetical protein WKI21_00050 [Streptococcus pneumoniae]|uniref:hypothetical protein n=1 Tax=Streptococcus pneumoniae TaxID=1313 RepID=UPI00312BBE37